MGDQQSSGEFQNPEHQEPQPNKDQTSIVINVDLLSSDSDNEKTQREQQIKIPEVNKVIILEY